MPTHPPPREDASKVEVEECSRLEERGRVHRRHAERLESESVIHVGRRLRRRGELCGTAVAAIISMTRTDFQKFMQDVFGDSMIRIEQFREDQWARVEKKIAEIGRESVHAEMSAMAKRLDEMEHRLKQLEQERAEKMQEEV